MGVVADTAALEGAAAADTAAEAAPGGAAAAEVAATAAAEAAVSGLDLSRSASEPLVCKPGRKNLVNAVRLICRHRHRSPAASRRPSKKVPWRHVKNFRQAFERSKCGVAAAVFQMAEVGVVHATSLRNGSLG